MCVCVCVSVRARARMDREREIVSSRFTSSPKKMQLSMRDAGSTGAGLTWKRIHICNEITF